MKTSLWHWRILGSLLYNRYDWVQRHPDGGVTVPTAQFCQAVGCRGPRLRQYLERLQAIGLASGLRWYRSCFYIQLNPPPGTAWVTGEVLDV